MGFGAPGLLWLAGLAGIPVVIHVLSRLRLQRAAFPSLMLLQSVRRERFSWLRLKEILLLVFRTIALAALLLSPARPHLRRSLFGLGRANDLVVVLDDSYSMGYSDNWQSAQRTARELVKSLGPGRRAMVLVASEWASPGEFAVVGRCLARIDSLTPSFAAVTLDSVLARAVRAARPAGADVVVVTDLQERAMPDLAEVRKMTSGRPSARENVTFVNVARPSFDNAAVVRVYAADRFPAPGRPLRLKAELANYGRGPVTRTVVLTVGTRQEEKVVALRARERTTVEFETVVPDSGSTVAEVELRADSLTADDKRWFAATPPPNTDVLVVESPRVPARYLASALGPDSVSGMRLTVISVPEFGRQDTRKYGLVVITDAAALSRSDWARLDFHLQSGRAGLVMFGPKPTEAGALPETRFRIVSPASTGPGFVSVGGVDSTHPVMELLRGADLAAARFFSGTGLLVPGGRVLLRGSDGAPLAAETHDGRAVVWAFAPAPEYTDLVHKAAFVPLLHRTLRYLLRAPLVSEYTVNDTIRVPVDAGGPIPVNWPGGRTSLTPVAASGRALVAFAATRLPGVYQLGPHTVVVNVLADEGDLTQAGSALAGVRSKDDVIRGGADLVPVLLLLSACAFAAELLLLI